MSKRKRKIVTIVACVLAGIMILTILISALATVASAVEPSEEAIKELKQKAAVLSQKKSELQSEIDEYLSEKTSILDQIELLDKRYLNTQETIDNLEEQIDLYNDLVAVKEEEIRVASANEQEQFERYKARIRAMEENGTISYLSILFGANDFSDMLGRIDIISEVMDADKRMADDLTAARNALEEAKAGYEEVITGLEDTKNELEALKVELDAEKEESIKLVEALEGNIDELNKMYDEEDAAEEAIWDEINEMQAELDRRAEEARKKAEEEARRKQELENSAAYIVSTGSFIWPSAVSRKVTSPYGMRYHPTLYVWRMHSGIDIGGADYGTDILAADGGVVSVATYGSGYGNYVMINHGNGIMTLYAHMSKYYVSVGDVVKQGDVIGAVGSTGVSTGPHIHFEIRINGSTVDPLQYFSNYIKGWTD